MAVAGSFLTRWETISRVMQPYGRYAAAVVAGLAITFTQDHSTFTGLSWLIVVVVVSLVFRDGPDTMINKFAWWSTLVVAMMAALGLFAGKMSPATALSLTIALVAFETSRAFTRGDRIWLWSTAVLAAGLSILFFSINAEDTTAAGLTGGWAIIAGIFGLIAAVDLRIKQSRAGRKPAATTATPQKKAKPRGTKR